MAALEPLLHHVFCRLKIVQGEQGRVVHLVHGVGLVFLPNPLQVELRLGVAPFVVVELRQLQIRLRHHALRHRPSEAGQGGGRHDVAETRLPKQACNTGMDPRRHSFSAICCAHSARLARMRLSSEARVWPSSSNPELTSRSVSATAASHFATSSSSRADALAK